MPSKSSRFRPKSEAGRHPRFFNQKPISETKRYAKCVVGTNIKAEASLAMKVINEDEDEAKRNIQKDLHLSHYADPKRNVF